MTKVVRPFMTSSSATLSRASVTGSSALVASSRIRIGGFFSSARAMARRWRSPPESSRPRSPSGASRPSGIAVDEVERLRAGRGVAHFGVGGVGLPTRRFSAIERLNSSVS